MSVDEEVSEGASSEISDIIESLEGLSAGYVRMDVPPILLALILELFVTVLNLELAALEVASVDNLEGFFRSGSVGAVSAMD